MQRRVQQEEFEESDVLHSHILKYIQFCTMIKNNELRKKEKALRGAIKEVNSLLETYVLHAVDKGEKFSELCAKMGIWMLRAYDLIDILYQEDIQKFITKKLCETSQSLLIDLIKHITDNAYSNCLDSKDKNSVKKDGGFLYVFSNGKIAGYNNFMYKHRYLFTSDEEKFFLFKDFSEVNSNWKGFDLDKTEVYQYI